MSRRLEDKLGASAETAESVYNRPARKQSARPANYDDGSGGDYNIWYHKKPGSHDPRRGPRGSKALTRCVLSTDAGRTRADIGGVRQFCIYFARGCCTLGSTCQYLHRPPNAQDAQTLVRDLSQDCFGRTRVPDGRDDRQGVGSSSRDCRTLYVFYGGASGDVRGQMSQAFGEWGPIRHINIVPTKTIAFITFEWRCSAEFAKEAMHAQSLSRSSPEVLNVCWANDDPNPSVVRAEKRNRLVAFDQAAQQVAEQLPEELKRARLLQRQLAETGAYPDTETAYHQQPQQHQQLTAEQQQYQQQWAQYNAYWAQQQQYAQQQSQQQQQQDAGGATAMASDDLEDDIERYCADDPYYDQEPEAGPSSPGSPGGTASMAEPMDSISSRMSPGGPGAEGPLASAADDITAVGAKDKAPAGEDTGGALAMICGYATDSDSDSADGT